MNTDKFDLRVISGILLVYLFGTEVYVIVESSTLAYVPVLFLFLFFWIMTPIILYNIEKYKLWFWAVSSIEWFLLPLITSTCLPEYVSDDGVQVHFWVIGGSIVIGVLTGFFSLLMARSMYIEMKGYKDRK